MQKDALSSLEAAKLFNKPHPRLILVGMGGFGREVVQYLRDDENREQTRANSRVNDHYTKPTLAYLDDQDLSAYEQTSGLVGLGSPKDFHPSLNDRLLITVGSTKCRANFWDLLQPRGAKFHTFIHPTAVVSSTATIAPGTIICPFAMIGHQAEVGENVVVNCYASVGHDAVVGQHSILSPYASVLGQAKLGTECFLGTRATVFPGVRLGANCTIDAHSFAKMDVPDGHIVRCRTEYQMIRNRLVDSERKP